MDLRQVTFGATGPNQVVTSVTPGIRFYYTWHEEALKYLTLILDTLCYTVDFPRLDRFLDRWT